MLNTLQNNKNIQAILLGLAAFTVWSCGDAGTKFIGKEDVPLVQMIVMAGIPACLIFLSVACFRGGVQRLKPNNIKLQCLQVLIMIALAFVNIVTFTQLPLTTVYAALFSSPLLISVAGSIFLKEPLSKKQYAYIVLGFLGSLIAVNPFAADLNSSTLMGWVALPAYPILFSMNMLIMRFMRTTETSESITFVPIFIRVLVFLPFALLAWQPLSLTQTIILFGMGCSMGIGFLLMTTALSKASSAIVSPLHYSQLITGALLGYILWGDVPTGHTVIGSVIIMGSGLMGARLVARRRMIEDAALEAASS